MRNLPTVALVMAALACGACQGAASAPPIDPFMGKWSCTEMRTLTFTTPAGSPDATLQSRFIVVASVADGKVSLFSQSDAGVSCTLRFSEEGQSATLMTGQTCSSTDGIMLSYMMGSANLDASGLHTNLSFGFAGTLEGTDSGVPLDAAGSGTSTSTCARVAVLGGSGATGGGGW